MSLTQSFAQSLDGRFGAKPTRLLGEADTAAVHDPTAWHTVLGVNASKARARALSDH